VRNVPLLVDAICEAYDNPRFKAEADGTTHCDATVDYVLRKYGVNDFSGDEWMANTIIQAMRRMTKFKRVDGSKEAQELANQGVLVIAGLEAQPHGHVAILRPGLMEFSGSWKKDAPKGMSNGSLAATTMAKKFSFVFRTEPEYYALVASM
jgi:hypothetical protein